MSNYNIMIVDDEVEMREGIVLHVDWQAIGFTVAAVAENGQDALEKAENGNIDVVLTDIKMPFMDGLTLSRYLSRNYPGIKIIILSGFDEFEYAKEAIKHNVVEYALKPINVSELTEILINVKNELDKGIEEKRNMDLLRESYEKALPLMKESFITEILWGIVPEEEIRQKVQDYGLGINKHLYKNVTVFEMAADGEDIEIAREYLPVSMKKIIEEGFDGRCGYTVSIGASYLIAVTAWKKANALKEIMSIANEICATCKRALNIQVTAGIGRIYENLCQIHHSFSEAMKALEYKSQAGAGHAIYINDMEQAAQGDVGFSIHNEDKLLAIVRYGEKQTIQLYLQDIFTNFPGDPWDFKVQTLNLFSGVYRIIQKFDLQNEPAVKNAILVFMESIQDQHNLFSWFLDTSVAINELIRQKGERASYNLIEKARKYIDENYGNSQLSVDMVCEYLHVSPSYFSTIFKQETSMSYIQYLTEIRLSKAIALLSKTDDKTYIIAGKVGYEDPNYFSYVFKKRFGVSPTKYRQK